MELRQLLIFCTAAQTLNFTRAAAKLGYAQSNITSQIRLLEEELQVKLFDRLGRGIQLTSEGRRFLENAGPILQQCERAKAEFAPDVFRGVLNLGAAETICVYRLPRLLLEYREKYPLVEIRVQTESCDRLYELIRTNSIDAGLGLTGQIDQPDMTVKTLFHEEMTIVASPIHPLAGKQAVTAEELAGVCLILTTEGCGYRPLVLAALSDHGVFPGSMMELSSVGAIKECAACGLGIAVLPKIAVKAELERGRLIELAWKGPQVDVKTQLIYHRDKWISPAMEAFVGLCGHFAE
ncbi:MAG: LysR family transcriptional regulator [Negativicutes bacterium]|nr:LysR family transcriptional regulator [Negativicutes bacterium]